MDIVEPPASFPLLTPFKNGYNRAPRFVEANKPIMSYLKFLNEDEFPQFKKVSV
jgi:hypothetical protein